MSTPIETAAEALPPFSGPSDFEVARAALASLTQHRDDIARLIDPYAAHTSPQTDGSPRIAEAYRKADAVLAYLTGEAS